MTAVSVGSLSLHAPVMTASGTSGHAAELAPYMDLSALGAVVVKSLAPYEWAGNAAPRVVEKTGIPDFDRVIHEKTRLAIVSALAVNDRLSFNELKEIVQTSDGNISVHARKLAESIYISAKKSFAGRLPHTEYALTAAGRRAFEKYLGHMEALIKATRGA